MRSLRRAICPSRIFGIRMLAVSRRFGSRYRNTVTISPTATGAVCCSLCSRMSSEVLPVSASRKAPISPKRATTVARPSFEDAFNLYQTLLLIDYGVVDHLIHHITPEQLDILWGVDVPPPLYSAP